ncbi:hypothetical protein, partial [Actinoplanes xinjiangensis]|uniref:hypothetical protein n=1 Tax=Actinoplanes xinjiangensis TaxID=512350 RepID=UPI0034177F77
HYSNPPVVVSSLALSSTFQEWILPLMILAQRGPETLEADGPLSQLYANMVELWFDRSERAGIGVSVGTSNGREPSHPRAFGSIRTAFPEFKSPAQTEGVVVAIPDFAKFADRVKEIVWSGL